VAGAARRHLLAMSLTLIALLALTVVMHLVRERL
jgi:hypothetical protein